MSRSEKTQSVYEQEPDGYVTPYFHCNKELPLTLSASVRNVTIVTKEKAIKQSPGDLKTVRIHQSIVYKLALERELEYMIRRTKGTFNLVLKY